MLLWRMKLRIVVCGSQIGSQRNTESSHAGQICQCALSYEVCCDGHMQLSRIQLDI